MKRFFSNLKNMILVINNRFINKNIEFYSTKTNLRSYNDSNFFHILFSLKIQQGPFSDFNNYLNNY